MHANRFFVILILAFVTFGVQAGPQIQHWQTANGARVYFVPAPELPMLDIQVSFDAGGARDGDKAGLAALTATLLDEGTDALDANQIAERVADVGASLGVSSSQDMAVATLRSVTDEKLLDPALDIFTRVLTQPSFPRAAFERERSRMLIGVQQMKQSPGAIASETFYAALYGQHPYATNTAGTIESLNKITREDVIAHYRRYYVAKNAIIAIVGALDRKQAEALAARIFDTLPTGAPAPTLPPAPALTEPQSITKAHPSTQSHILMGQPGMKRLDPDYFALYVGNHMLGGSGLVSRISDEIREKRGLSYSAYSYFSPMREAGPFTLGLQTKNESAQEALKVLGETLRTFIDQGPTAAELTASKQNITGGFPLRLASNKKIVEYIAMIGFYGLPLDYLDAFNGKVEAVTVEQIRDAFQRRVHPDKMVTVIVGGNS